MLKGDYRLVTSKKASHTLRGAVLCIDIAFWSFLFIIFYV